MHEEEKEDTSASMLEEKRPSFLPVVGGIIDPGGGTLVFCQEVPTYQLIQGMHEISAHNISRSMNSQGLDQSADLKQKYITTLSHNGCDKEASSFLEHFGGSPNPKLH